MMNKVLLNLVVFFIGVAAQSTADGREWYVLPDSTGDAPFLHAAVDSADHGDTILLAPGVHRADRMLIVSKSVEIVGEQGPEATFLDRARVSLVDREKHGRPVALRGVTLEGRGETHISRGVGLVSNFLTSLVIENCVFRGYGARAVVIIGTVRSEIRDSRFEDNHYVEAEFGGGGGLYFDPESSIPTLDVSGCIFRGNSTDGGIGGVGAGGGAIYLIMRSNDVHITNNLFIGNRAPSGSAIAVGGSSGWAVVSHNTFVRNQGDDAAVALIRGGGEVYGNVFYENQPLGLFDTSLSGLCECNIYWRNGDGGVQWGGDCLQYGVPVAVVDPLFCRPSYENYQVAVGSPVLPESYPEAFKHECEGIIGSLGIGCDMVPILERSWGQLKQEFLKDARSRD